MFFTLHFLTYFCVLIYLKIKYQITQNKIKWNSVNYCQLLIINKDLIVANCRNRQ